MANLSISTVCNRECAYCFTADHLSAAHAPAFLPAAQFQARLDFLDRSNIDEARLLGGEPTLHPEFPALVAQARARGKRITVFSNGLMPRSALDCLAGLPPEQCTVLVNVSGPADAALARQRRTLQRLGRRAMPGFSIDRPSAQPGFLVRLVVESGCRPAIRLGMAQPCLSGRNRYVHPKQYRAVAERIVDFAALAAEQGIVLEFDCGFVRCMFSNEEVANLRGLGADLDWRCNPILDVDTAGRVIHCYPLAGLGYEPLGATSDAVSLRRTFAARAGPYRQAGVYPECSTCPFKTGGECSGGCLAATMRRFRHSAFELRVPQGEGA